MKYIITESKLDKFIFQYLDMKLNGIEKIRGKHVDIVFGFPNEEYGILGWEKPGNLYVGHEIVNEIKTLFGMKRSDTLDVFGRYVEDRYNLEVINTNKIAGWSLTFV